MTTPTSARTERDRPEVRRTPDRPTHWWRSRRAGWAAAALVVLLVAGLITALLMLPALRIQHVVVVGERQVSEADILQLADVPMGTALVRLPIGAVTARVASLPAVAHVKVVRVWPDTVRIEIDERQPVAYADLADGSFGLIDRRGAVYRTITTKPDGLPHVVATTVESGTPDSFDPLTLAAVTVASGLPRPVARRVDTVWAASPQDVRLQLADGAQVRWGAPTDNAMKAAVLQLLWRHPASVYDVSAPRAPATAP
jgi:cell division protein FtsQ